LRRHCPASIHPWGLEASACMLTDGKCPELWKMIHISTYSLSSTNRRNPAVA
jgi:hypothetical protein